MAKSTHQIYNEDLILRSKHAAHQKRLMPRAL